MFVAASNVHIARVIPALRRVFEQVYRAERGEVIRVEGGAHSDRGREGCIGHVADLGERPPGLYQAGSGLSVVDEMRSL